MKKITFLLVILLTHTFAWAQSTEEEKYLLTTKSDEIGYTKFQLTDPYLSPLEYSGEGITYSKLNRRFWSTHNTKLSTQGTLNILAGTATNLPQTASELYMAANYGYGIHYHLQPIGGVRLLVGGTCDLDFGMKYLMRNVNNPVNIDLATNLNFSGIAKYDIALRKRALKLELSVESPIIGCMYVPQGGASYYEMFDIGNTTGIAHFSSLHNKRGVNGHFTVGVPFSRSIWQLGVSYRALEYKANDMLFKKQEIALLIGSTLDIASFGGHKNKAPQQFLSTNE